MKLRRRSLAGVVLLAALAAPAVASATTTTALISASGSSWAADAVNQWAADEFPRGLQVVYTAAGSAAGRADFADGTVDFGISDLPYQGQDPVTGIDDTSGGRAFAYVPVAAGGLAITYHLEAGGQLLRNLRLSSGTLLKIFTGQIGYWDDPAIAADNNGRVALPHVVVRPVVHGEGSATSYLLSDYFDDLYPDAWNGFAGATGPTEYFPRADGAVAENGSSTVMNFVGSNAGNGAIGYVETAYPLARNYPVAQIENAAHYFVPPDPDAVGIALSAAAPSTDPQEPTDFRPSFAATDPRAYPLSSYSYAIVPTAADDPRMTTAKRQTLVDFFAHALCDGQAAIRPTGYAPLPLPAVDTAFDRLRALHDVDADVDVTALDTAACTNPTFAGNPAHETLSNAPLPPTCAASGQGPCGVVDATSLTGQAGATVAYRARRSLSASLHDLATSAALPGRTVLLLERPAGDATWRVVHQRRTDYAGRVAVAVEPGTITQYRWRYDGDEEHAATSGPVTTLRVRQAVSLHLARVRGRAGHDVTAWGTVRPVRAGRPVLVEQLVRSRWVVIGRPTLLVQRLPDGRRVVGYQLRVRTGRSAALVLRTVAPATPTNVATTSAGVRLGGA